MNCERRDLLLYAVTDRAWLGGRTLTEQVEEALLGGVTMVQLREKHMEREALRAEALALRQLCRKYGVPLIINDDAELAAEVDADGVHVGQEDLEAGRARAILGPGKIIGVSAHNVAEALAAQAAGADYLGAGAVFPTGTKDNVTALPFEELQAICAAVDIPVVAIGGITAGNLPALAGSGISGAAVVSALFAQSDIRSAAQTLTQILRKQVVL